MSQMVLSLLSLREYYSYRQKKIRQNLPIADRTLKSGLYFCSILYILKLFVFRF